MIGDRKALQATALPARPDLLRILVLVRYKNEREVWVDQLYATQPTTSHRQLLIQGKLGKVSGAKVEPKPFVVMFIVGALSRLPGERPATAHLRPPISEELQTLIRRLAGENGWRARKIQAELEKLGFTVSLATVSRYLPKRAPDPGKQQRWMTFLRNHTHDIAAMDFFVVPTVGFRLLYVWFMIDHGQRLIIHFDVTANPTAPWVIQQLRGSSC